MPKNGEINAVFGIYQSVCCGRETAVKQGQRFPDCPRHPNLPTIWKRLVTSSLHPGLSRLTDDALREAGPEVADIVTTVCGYQQLFEQHPTRLDYWRRLLDSLSALGRKLTLLRKEELAERAQNLRTELEKLSRAS